MIVINSAARETIPFGDIKMAEGFIHDDYAHLKIKLPNDIPAGVNLTTGETQCFKSTVFVYPITIKASY